MEGLPGAKSVARRNLAADSFCTYAATPPWVSTLLLVLFLQTTLTTTAGKVQFLDFGDSYKDVHLIIH